jgi:hypothetical protein
VLLLLLMVYAACGLALSLVVHVLSFFIIPRGGNILFGALHVCIFPMWIPAMLISLKMSGGTIRYYGFRTSLAFLKQILSGCPRWMQLMTTGFFIYAIFNFIAFMFIVGFNHPPRQGVPSSAVWHGFSGHWMAFYSGGLAIFTTAYRRGLSNLAPRCPNGHAVSPVDKFCAVCGKPVVTSSAGPQ